MPAIPDSFRRSSRFFGSEVPRGARRSNSSFRQGFCTFFEGLKSIYAADLPVHVSADPILESVHKCCRPGKAGNEVGRILHVGTGYPRLMVATVDTCSGPKAYEGVVFSYHEKITEAYQRLTDAEWLASIAQSSPPDVGFMVPVVAR